MVFQENSELRRDIRALTTVIIELYYLLLKLGAIVHEPTRIEAKGYEVALPSELIKCTWILRRIANVLREAWKAIYSPTRTLVEELKISRNIEGRIDVPLTSRLMGQGMLLVASRKRKLALESIENIFLKAFITRLGRDIGEMLERINCFKCGDSVYEEVFKSSVESIVKELDKIRNGIRRISERTFMKYIGVKPFLLEDRALKKLAWKVLERNIYPYNVVALYALDYVGTNMLALLTKYVRKARDIEGLKLKLWDYKLYEVYTYYVINYVIAKSPNIHSIDMWKNETHISLKNGEVRVTYDKVPECKSWVSHGKHYVFNGGKVVIPAGRPDIVIHVNDIVVSVCDAKYRVSASELSQSRFKILGYMHEYNAPLGALFFDPNHVLSEETIDGEIRENMEFIRETIKYGGVIVEDQNKTLYIVALKPKPHSELLESREYRVLESMVEKALEG